MMAVALVAQPFSLPTNASDLWLSADCRCDDCRQPPEQSLRGGTPANTTTATAPHSHHLCRRHRLHPSTLPAPLPPSPPAASSPLLLGRTA